jgi:hypothetical protein
MSVWRTTAVMLCSFRHKSPAGAAIDSDDKHDDHDDLLELEDIIQPDWCSRRRHRRRRHPNQSRVYQLTRSSPTFALF